MSWNILIALSALCGQIPDAVRILCFVRPLGASQGSKWSTGGYPKRRQICPQRRRPHSYGIRAAAIFCIGCTLAGCGGSSPNTTAAHKIADALPGILGPARHYDVKVDGDYFALLRGHASKVSVDGTDVHITPGLTLDTLEIEARDVAFDKDKKQLDHVGKSSFVATVGPESLQQYLTYKHSDLKLTLRNDDIQADVPVAVAQMSSRMVITGTLAPNKAARNKIDFVPQHVEIGSIPLPGIIASLAARGVNPVVDLSNWRVPITLERTEIQNGHLVLHGSADLKGMSLSVKKV